MIKYYNIEELNNLKFIKAGYTGKFEGHWRIYSLNKNLEDIKYYKELGDEYGITINNMIRIPQKHTNNIKVVTKKDKGEGVVKQETEGYYDGVITNEKNILLCTIEADCTPVYIVDKKNRAIGMVHSGWRGTVSKISNEAIKKMKELYQTKEEDIIIYFGPSICMDCYEVGKELIEDFKKSFKEEEIKILFKKKSKEKYLLDVTKGIELSLLNIGIKKENIYKSKYCTYHNNLFDSWRRDGKKAGHILSSIMIK